MTLPSKCISKNNLTGFHLILGRKKRLPRHLSAQHSVHPTAGTVRDLEVILNAQAFFCHQAESRPTHQQVTQTVGRPYRNPIFGLAEEK
jgi:hypothetical protein